MADVLYGGNSYSSYGSIGSFSDADSPGSSGSNLDTGDLRRKFNFGDRVSELNLSQDPFFRFVSMAAKKPTDDPQFKFTERRGSWRPTSGRDSDITRPWSIRHLPGLKHLVVDASH